MCYYILSDIIYKNARLDKLFDLSSLQGFENLFLSRLPTRGGAKLVARKLELAINRLAASMISMVDFFWALEISPVFGLSQPEVDGAVAMSLMGLVPDGTIELK